MEHNKDIKLADVEEMNQRSTLVLGQLWTEHERFHLESGEEQLDTVSLQDVRNQH
jgi:hypothetical protein